MSARSGSSRSIVSTPSAPKAIGPYSQAVVANGWIFCSGQVALDPKGEGLVPGGVKEQTEQVMRNLEAVLSAAGARLSDVVRCTVYLKSLADFAAMNEVYGRFFTKDPPARATIEAARLPREALVEIDCIAVSPS
jgi:2-iminobutanoate/2-iminopropanoate deaminase